VVIASAEQAKEAAVPPNLTDRQMRIYMGPPEVPGDPSISALAQLDRLNTRVSRLAGQLGQATVIPLTKAFRPSEPALVVRDTRIRTTVEVTRRIDNRFWRPESPLYVATPALLAYAGIDPATVDPGADFLADPNVPIEQLGFPPGPGGQETGAITNAQRVETGRRLLGNPLGEWAAGQEPTFVTPAGLRRQGWKPTPAGWMLESSKPLSDDQIAAARELAADAGLTVEVQREPASRAGAMALASAIGALLALGILALTVGLIRGESASDLRTLTAAGATSRVRRGLTAFTAGALALLGAFLGVAGAYAVLAALYHDDLGYLSDVPILALAVAVGGVALAATAAGWLLAGREPRAIARAVIQ
jgi:putative ABC transport system permease protein